MFKNTYNIILGSSSPRRQELLDGLDIDYITKKLSDIDESYPSNLDRQDIAQYIATKKANAYKSEMDENDLLITADTVVLLGNKILGKPKHIDEAKEMLRELSGREHQVITGICLTTINKQKSFDCISAVKFAELSDEEINYYVGKYKPLDKAGAYGIQEWIGYVAVEYLSGSYFNIMGLPIQKLYQELKKFYLSK